MVYYGILWYIMINYDKLWYIMVYYGILWPPNHKIELIKTGASGITLCVIFRVQPL